MKLPSRLSHYTRLMLRTDPNFTAEKTRGQCAEWRSLWVSRARRATLGRIMYFQDTLSHLPALTNELNCRTDETGHQRPVSWLSTPSPHFLSFLATTGNQKTCKTQFNFGKQTVGNMSPVSLSWTTLVCTDLTRQTGTCSSGERVPGCKCSLDLPHTH